MKNRSLTLILIWALVAFVFRIIPHLPNFAPVLSVLTLLPRYFSKRFSLLFCFALMLFSDLLLAYAFHTAWLGTWSLFTYSGLAYLVFGHTYFFKACRQNIFMTSAMFSLFYWTWTNLGVWFSGALYPTTLHGLISCYILALPFLVTSLCANLLWISLAWWYFMRPVDHLSSNFSK